jgi:hypothetical protein
MSPDETTNGRIDPPGGTESPSPGETGHGELSQGHTGITPPPSAAPPASGDGPPTSGPPPAPAGTGGPDAPREPIEDADILVTDVIRREVSDALYLGDFVVKTGLKRPNLILGTNVIRTIKVTAGKIALFESSKNNVIIKASEWTDFENAYYALAEFTSPITSQTLRDTECTGRGFKGTSKAQRFSWILWSITLLFAAFIIFSAAVGTEGLYVTDLGTRAEFFKSLNPYLQIISPYAYGGLGACAYLLRSAHSFIYERTFDVQRKPEYFNRILLGIVSGGAISLFVSQLTDDEGNVIRLSIAALGFIAGYSNDFLFNTIERVVAAILPRVGLESVQRAAPAPAARTPLDVQTGGLTLKDLIARMEEAKPEDKELYRSLIEKLRDRL